MRRQELYISDSQNDRLNKQIYNMYIPVNYNPILPESREHVINVLSSSFKKVEELNEQIKSTDDDMLKSSLRQQKNAICKQMIEYSGDSINKSQNHKDQEEYRDYKRKFVSEPESDSDLIEKNYSHFRPINHLNNKMLLEIKSTYEDLEETINKSLADKNVDQESIAKTWQSVRANYEKHLQKCKSHESLVKHMQDTILNSACVGGCGGGAPDGFIGAKRIEEQLNLQHKKAIGDLKFNSEQLVKQFVAKGLELSGQPPEESSMILEIKSAYEDLEEKINKSLADKNVDDEVKLQVWQLSYYRSKYDQLLSKLKTHEQAVKEYQDTILKCDSLYEAHSLGAALEKKHKETMDELNFHTNQVIKHFVTKALQITGQPLEESPMMSDIKSILDGFKEKINKNLNDNNINEKIKSDVWKLFCSKCDQHLEKLKLVEKSVKQYEGQLLMCDNFQQAKSITNNLKGIQKQIDNWKLGSNDLMEEITNKAIEFSYQAPHLQSASQIPPAANQPTDLPVQEVEEVVDEVVVEVVEVNLDQAPPQPELPQPIQQSLAEVQPLAGSMEQMMALIQQLQAANAAKDAEIQEKNTHIEQLEANHPVDPDKWIPKTEVEQMIDQYKESAQTVEAREKEKDLVIATQMQENHGLRTELGYKTEITTQQKEIIQDLRQDKIDLRTDKEEWKTKAVSEKEVAQKLAHDLTTKNSEIEVLKQQLATFQHPLDDILSGWENINEESSGISTIGDV